MTVAFEIRKPWFKYKPWPKKFRDTSDRQFAWRRMSDQEKNGRDSFWENGYRETLATIWHVDPERDGTDDSCGYSYVKLTKKQIAVLRNAAWSEGRHPHFLCCAGKHWDRGFTEAESLTRGLAFLVCRVLRIKITFEEVAKYASEATHLVDCCGFGGNFCFLPGYHTNSMKDTAEARQDHFHGIVCGVARNILTNRRPWYRHPKWHFWHWRLQIPAIQDLKRWLFSRCAGCGKRFKFGYSPVTHQWNGTGPRWFRREAGVYHDQCADADPCVIHRSVSRS